MRNRFRTNKRQNGYSSVEAVVSSIFIIVATIFSIDCWFMITAARITDAACRDAAHAAALTLDTGNSSSDTANAQIAAQVAVQTYAPYANNWITAPQITQVNFNSAATPPNVVVVTTTSVTPLIPCSWFASTKGILFTQQYSFPIIKSMAGVGTAN